MEYINYKGVIPISVCTFVNYLVNTKGLTKVQINNELNNNLAEWLSDYLYDDKGIEPNGIIIDSNYESLAIQITELLNNALH